MTMSGRRWITELDRVARVAGVLVLLVVIVFGAARPALTSGLPITPEGGPSPAQEAARALSWALVVVGATFAALMLAPFRRRRRRDSEVPQRASLPPLTVLGRACGVLVVLVVGSLLGLLVWWMVTTGDEHSGGGVPDRAVHNTGPTSVGAGGATPTALLLIAGCATVVIVSWLVKPRRWAPTTVPVVPRTTGLAEASTAGRFALCNIDDDRQAILACYSAVERSLTHHGVPRNQADTASEHLRRGVDAHLAPADAVADLLEVFHRARFSHHRLTPADRHTAEEVLGTISGLFEVTR